MCWCCKVGECLLRYLHYDLYTSRRLDQGLDPWMFDVNIDTLVTGLVIMGIGYHHLLLAIVLTKAWLLLYFDHLLHRQIWLEFSR